MEHQSTLKRKEMLTHATIWMNLEDIMLSEISQSQKGKYCMIPHGLSKAVKVIQREKYSGGCQQLGEGPGELFPTGIEFQICKTEKLWSSATQHECT